MNTIKFSNIKRKTTEQHNLETINLKQVEIFGKQYTLYEPCNLNIFITNKCPNHCSFCINKDYLNTDISNEEFYKSLELLLDELKNLQIEITITGGEPTLSPIFVDIVKLIDKYNFRKRAITTNGSGLLKTMDNDTVLNHLINNGFNHLNISSVSYNDELNRKIMEYANEKEYCTNEMLKEILNTTNKTNLAHRLSCVLLKESVNSIEEMKKYLDFYSTLGANNFIFRELMDYDKTAVNLEKMTYCNNNKIKLYEIWNQLDDCPEFKPYLNLLGYYYYVEIYKYKNMTIASESADLNLQYREKEKNPNIFNEMIFHNNGNLCASWIENEDILSKYNI